MIKLLELVQCVKGEKWVTCVNEQIRILTVLYAECGRRKEMSEQVRTNSAFRTKIRSYSARFMILIVFIATRVIDLRD